MAKLKLDPSIDAFESYRRNGNYYVDKTEFLYQYLTENFEKVVMFTRPRRFGKTMILTMLCSFLDIRKDSRELFHGLNIMSHEETVSSYMNQYPVLFLSFKRLSGSTYEGFFGSFRKLISEICADYKFLLDSDRIDAYDKEQFVKLLQKTEDEEGTVGALLTLTRILHTYYGKQVFVVLDEYDVPLAGMVTTEFYLPVLDMVQKMLGDVCKTNENVKAVILSGCLYTVKNSSYTGVNNIQPYTILSPVYSDVFGFTASEVEKLLNDADLSSRKTDVQEWYDGYIFGRTNIYCPWDVLKYVSDMQKGDYDEQTGPQSYWLNTSEISSDLIHGFIGRTDDALECFSELLAGKTVNKYVDEHVPYHRLHETGDNLWTGLLETGYLTKKTTKRQSVLPLAIPNKEIMEVFKREVWDYFAQTIKLQQVSEFVNALWAGDAKKAQQALDCILEATVSSFHAYHEYTYHLLLNGFFTGQNYRVRSEFESGYGRSDLIAEDRIRNRAIVIELKHSQSEAAMEKDLQDACGQIGEKKYDSGLKYDGYHTVLSCGMSFFNRRCRIRFVA